MDTILYVGSGHPAGDPLGLLGHLADARRMPDGAIHWIRRGTPPWRSERRVVALDNAERALEYLRTHPVDLLLLDTRVGPLVATGPNPTDASDFERSRAGVLLAGLWPEDDVGVLIPRDRVVALVGDGADGTQVAYRLGLRQVGAVLVSPGLDAVLDRADAILGRQVGGRVAVCLAGGGIEGLLYEIGVLRALDWFLADRSLVDLDLFCGISAGAMLGGFLANGIGPDEIARGLSGGSARIDPIRRSDIFDPNVREFGARAAGLLGEMVGAGVRRRGPFSALARAAPSAIFAGDRLRSYLERQLSRPGMSNRFDGLRRPLLVGATDQDTSQAVVFGEGELRHVPVHRAIRASSALVPFYAPERIDGRYYVDGAFSRTTNMRVAVQHGATLVILVDPLVPAVSREAGQVHARGGVFGTMQGLKALINGRFDKAVRAIREMFPDVSFYLFRPEGEEMRIMAGSPMKYFYRREVEEVAFHSTVEKLRAWMPELQRDFALHGMTFRDPHDRSSAMPPPLPFSPASLGVGL